MNRLSTLLIVLCLAAPAGAAAQVVLVPSDKAPYAQKLDLERQDAQYFLLPQAAVPLDEGPYAFRFEDPRLDSVLNGPTAVQYVAVKEGGFLVQLLNLRAGEVPPESLGPQGFELLNAAGEVVGRGRLLVFARPPEAVDLLNDEGTRIFEENRASEVRFRIRSNGNYRGLVPRRASTDVDLIDLREELSADTGLVVVSGRLRPRRRDLGEVRLAVETRDGRVVELTYDGLTVKAPAPGRVRISGGPIYLDALARGQADVAISEFSPSLALRQEAEIVAEAGSDLLVAEQHFERGTGELVARVEYVARDPRESGLRLVRELNIRAGGRLYRGYVEVVGAPSVTGVRTDQSGRPVLIAGAAPALLRITGQNLDNLRLDCSPLGPGATCANRGTSPTEIVEEIALGADISEGDYLLPLAPMGERPPGAGPIYPAGGIRVQVQRSAIPAPLDSPGLLKLDCAGIAECRVADGGETLVVGPEAATRLKLLLDPSAIAADRGWQLLSIAVTRVRGIERQTVRTYGTAAAPRALHAGSAAADLPLLDLSAEPRHGDLFLLKVEHLAEHYPAQHRIAATAGETFVRSIYIDGGPLKRLTGDVAVQPLLYAFKGGLDLVPLVMNAGAGFTWHFLNERLEPRPWSVKLQLLATNIADQGSEEAIVPALYLSGNLRIPGTDPSRPLNLSTGIARMMGSGAGLRILIGAGLDLGLSGLVRGR